MLITHGGDIYTYKNMLDFSANLNPLGLPDAVLAAAKRACEQAAAYPDPLCRELAAAIAAHEGVAPEQVICGNGAADLIFRIVWAAKPRAALLVAPGFAEYEQALATVGCRISHHYLVEERSWRLGADYLAALDEAGLDMVFICNPNNPTGLTVEPDLLDKILAKCAEKNIRVVLDECFNDFLVDGEKHSRVAQLGDMPNLFILKAFTKTYAMAGLRLGYGLAADAALLARMAEIAQPWSVSTPAQMAGLAALDEAEYVAQARALVAGERARMQAALNELGCVTYGSQANYVFFKAHPGLAEAMRGEGILIRDCSNYVGLAAGFYRVAVKLPAENERLLVALQNVLARSGGTSF